MPVVAVELVIQWLVVLVVLVVAVRAAVTPHQQQQRLGLQILAAVVAGQGITVMALLAAQA